MKKILCFAVIAAVAAVACQKEEDTREIIPQNQEEVVVNPVATTFRATVDPSTKTYLDGTSTGWSGTEWISILAGGHNYAFGTSDSGVGAATFSYEGYTDGATEATEPSGVVATSTYAVYPYDVTVSLSSSTASAWLDSNQGLYLGAFSDQRPILVAKSDAEGNLAFKNATSVLKFKLGSGDIQSITIKGNNGEYLAGCLDMTYDGSTLSTEIESGNYPSTFVYLTDGGGASTLSAGTYYCTVAPAALSGGFHVDWTDGTNNYRAITTSSQVFKANTIMNLGTLANTTDTTNPEASITSDASAEINVEHTFTVTMSDNKYLNYCEVYVYDSGWTALETTYPNEMQGELSYELSKTYTFTSAGTYHFGITVRDLDGNYYYASQDISVTDPSASDTTPPTVTLTSASTATTNSEYTLVINFADASGISTCYPKIYIYDSSWANGPTCSSLPSGYWANDSSGHNWGTTVSGTSFDFTLPLTFSTEGTYYVYLYGGVSDINGNTFGGDVQTTIATITVSGDS